MAPSPLRLSPAIRARLGYVALFTAVGALYPYIPIYYSSLGLDVGAIGLLAAIFSAAAMLGSPLWGAAGDRLGRSRAVLLIPASLAALAFWALAVAQGMWIVGTAAAAASFAMSGVSPVLDARALETVGDDRSRFGRLRVWGSISFIASALFVGWLADWAGIRSLFIVLIPALLVTGVIGIGLRSQSPEPTLPRLSSLAAVFRSSLLMRFLAAALVVWTANAAINAFFSVYLVQIGAAPTLVGWAWAIGAAVEVPVMVAFPVLSRRIGLERLIVIGAAFFVARAAALTLVTDPLRQPGAGHLHHGPPRSGVLVGAGGGRRVRLPRRSDRRCRLSAGGALGHGLWTIHDHRTRARRTARRRFGLVRDVRGCRRGERGRRHRPRMAPRPIARPRLGCGDPA